MNPSNFEQPSFHRQRLSHHRLRVYWIALGLARLTHEHPIGRATLRRQAERAVDSVVLNIAEAAGLDGKRNKAQFRIAKGSVLEVIAAYELAQAYDESVPVAADPQTGAPGRRDADPTRAMTDLVRRRPPAAAHEGPSAPTRTTSTSRCPTALIRSC